VQRESRGKERQISREKKLSRHGPAYVGLGEGIEHHPRNWERGGGGGGGASAVRLLKEINCVGSGGGRMKLVQAGEDASRYGGSTQRG